MKGIPNADVCPTCGGSLTAKGVEKLLRGGSNTAVVNVCAEVCERCGERLYTTADIRRFEEIRRKLAEQDTEGFVAIGQSFQVIDPLATPISEMAQG